MQVKQVLLIEGLVNLVMALAKLVVGLATQSSAVIADAVHSLTDVANNVVAWVANNIAQQAPDEDHPYGHQKFEQLAIFFLATLLTVVAFEILVSSVQRFGEPVSQNKLGLVVLCFTILLNLGLTIWEHRWAKRLKSKLLEADAKHTLGDVFTSIAAIVGWQLGAIGYYWLDTLVAVFMSCMVFYLAFQLFRRAIPILADQQHLDSMAVFKALMLIPGVVDVERMRSRYDGWGILVDVTVIVDAAMTTEASHQVADDVEKTLAEQFRASDIVVHVEPALAINETADKA